MNPTLTPPGAAAEAVVTIVRTPSAYWLDHQKVEVLVTREQSGGAYDVTRVTVAPGDGPHPSRQRADVLLFVVSGTFSCLLNERTFALRTGQCVFLPRGSVHGYRNVGQSRGVLICVTTPSGYCDFLADAGMPVTGGVDVPVSQAVDRFARAAKAHNIAILPGWRAQPSPSPVTPPLDLWVMGLHVRNLLGGAGTDGQFAVAEITAHPGDFVPPHLHHTEAEMFYVLEGTVEFDIPSGTVTAEPGTLLHIPMQRFHGFRNAVAAGNVKMLNFHTPGGFEKFFEEVGAVWPDPTDKTPPPGASSDVERFIRITRAHGMELASPGRSTRPTTQPSRKENRNEHRDL